MAHIDNLLVVKIGGGAGVDWERAADGIAAVAAERPVIVVHGVSATLDALCAARGVPVRTLTSPDGHSSRYTDAETRDLFVEAADQVNTQLVDALNARGINAAGMTGENVPFNASRKSAIRAVVDGRVRVVRDDYTGSITNVNDVHLRELLENGITPVIPPYAVSSDGLLNVDGDRAAAAAAAALNAAELIILSNVRGLYRDFSDENSFVSRVNSSQIDTALTWARGRMKRKVLGAREALDGGVRRALIADGRVTDPIRRALAGEATEFTR